MVSIVVPNFNKAAFLGETLRSVLNQDIEEWEIVFIDDGSTDDSVKVAKAIANGDSRFKFLATTPTAGGANAARNIGWRNARYDWILFLDSDDVISPSCLSIRMKQAKRSSADLLVFPTGTFFSIPGDQKMEWRPKREDPHLLLFLRHKLPWNISSVIWNRKLIERLGGFSETLPRLQDVDLHARALLAGASYQVVEDTEADFFYRICDRRSTFDTFQLCQKYVEACDEFSRTIIGAIDSHSGIEEGLKRSYLRALRGTTLAILFRLDQEQRRANLTLAQRHELSDSLCNADYIPKIFGSERVVVRLYNRCLDVGLGRFRGFMRISHALLS